jgi:hypothetical protein
MSDVKRFFGKDFVKKIKDEEGVETTIKIKPFRGGKDLAMIIKLQDKTNPESMASAMYEIFTRIMRDNYPDITESEIEDISMNTFQQVIEGVMEANGITDSRRNELLKMREDVQRVSTNQG